MLVSSPNGVFRRPLFRIIVLLLVLLLLFVALPRSDAYYFFDLVQPAPPPPLDLPPPPPPHTEWPSRHRTNNQRPLVHPAHGGPWAERADAVRGAFLHAYEGYISYAAPHDELLPLSMRPIDKYVLIFYLGVRAHRSEPSPLLISQLQRLGSFYHRFPRHYVAHGPA